MLTIHREIQTESTSSGTLEVNTDFSFMGILRQIVINPTTSTNTYNLEITDNQDLKVFCESSITGHFAPEVAIPVRGVYTVSIDSATIDESFEIEMMVEE